jgi:succinate dehydrogenase / fumarate reductase, cytochrome b subunit
MRERPLSPHLSVYKFKYTLLTSILNRLTGLVLSLGLLLFVYWLGALARGAQAYGQALPVLSHPLAKALYAALLIAFSYHLCAGVRHLVWDTGRGMERQQAYRSSWIVAGATAILAVALLYFLFCPTVEPSP